jgi:DNA-binding MarR family transcriptional regulator
MDAIPLASAGESRHPERFELEHFLPYWLSVLSNTVSQGIAQFYQEEYGLSIPEWRVMAVLGRYPGLTASEVCERTVMDKVTVSRAVNSLLERHYLERIIDESDRRKRPLRISESRGRSILDAVIPYALEYQTALLSRLSASEQSLFRELSTRLLEAAMQLNEQAPPPLAKPGRPETAEQPA